MENMITRIVEVEKQCAQDIARAEQEYKKNIEDHKRALEDTKAQAFSDIADESATRLERLIEDARSKAQAETLTAEDSLVRLSKDVSTLETIKERIVSILLKT
ncbi:MAG TPA: hypothetical protein PLM29_07510 [Deltaproteobacteria bacterium]|nr:hypothetical protein [Deltaproteobacteria bacterium]